VKTVHRKDHILVVENDDLIRDLLERWLGEAGYAVVAHEAGAPAAAGRARLVIADVPSPRRAGARIVSHMPRGNHERVLVVDDEEPLVRIATETLEGLGYRPVGFTSSSAALEAFRADPLGFDAVITDERMPGMTGATLIREVRAICPGIPAMLMSGLIGGTVSSRAREAGADEVLKKPLSGRDLATSLARVLRE
jgi:CheY-like chemotaxis protein